MKCVQEGYLLDADVAPFLRAARQQFEHLSSAATEPGRPLRNFAKGSRRGSCRRARGVFLRVSAGMTFELRCK